MFRSSEAIVDFKNNFSHLFTEKNLKNEVLNVQTLFLQSRY